jgi:prepilin-type N-terminal cleavage/methylation domain-containing protein/prepilin-type processing-associated H-X9-DG protein
MPAACDTTPVQSSGARVERRGLGSPLPPAITHASPYPIPHTPYPNALRAFTLIELLVVISIIALLIGILLPALGAARTTARLSQCLTNARSISQATEFYLNDSKQIYPGGAFNGVDLAWHNLSGKRGTGANVAGQTAAEDRALYHYLSSEIASFCPLDKGENTTSVKAFDQYGSSYVYFDRTTAEINAGTLRGRNGVWILEGHRSSQVLSPSKKLVVADLIVLLNRSAAQAPNQWHSSNEPLQVSIAFADGHAASHARKTGTAANPTATQNVTQTQIDQWSVTDYY